MSASQHQRNRAIFRRRWIEGRTLDDIANEHGVSRERVRQITLKEWRAERRRLINAADTFAMAATALKAAAERLREVVAQGEDLADATAAAVARETPLYDQPVTVLADLSVRSMNCLHNDRIYYIGDLVQKTRPEMLRTPNFGLKSLKEIEEALGRVGLALGTSIDWTRPDNPDLPAWFGGLACGETHADVVQEPTAFDVALAPFLEQVRQRSLDSLELP